MGVLYAKVSGNWVPVPLALENPTSGEPPAGVGVGGQPSTDWATARLCDPGPLRQHQRAEQTKWVLRCVRTVQNLVISQNAGAFTLWDRTADGTSYRNMAASSMATAGVYPWRLPPQPHGGSCLTPWANAGSSDYSLLVSRRHVPQRQFRSQPVLPHRQQPVGRPLPLRGRSSRRCHATPSLAALSTHLDQLERLWHHCWCWDPDRWRLQRRRGSGFLRGFGCLVAGRLPPTLGRCESGRRLVSGADRCLQQSRRSVWCSARHVWKRRRSVAGQLRTRFHHRCDGYQQWWHCSVSWLQHSLLVRRSPPRRTCAHFAPSVSASSCIVIRPVMWSSSPTSWPCVRRSTGHAT